VGDNGITGSLEWRFPSIAPLLPSFVDELRVFGFVDAARVHVLRTLPEQTANFKLLSIGGGARIRLFDAVSGELSVGMPLVDGPTSKSNDLRTLFTAKGEF
jgi:hemolysin activation/secretion protein